MANSYRGPFWVFISDKTGMPLEVQKCTFRPTIHPASGDWEELWMRGAVDYLPSRLETLTSLIKGHMEAMRPLLEEWSEAKKEHTNAEGKAE